MKDIDIASVKAKLVELFGQKKFLGACDKAMDEFGVPITAEALAELHNTSQLDVIDGFLSIENGVGDFWSLDSLICYTIEKCNWLDVEKVILLSTKLKELEGADLAAGRLFNIFESHLSKNEADARRAFDLIAQDGMPSDALPCITRAYATFDKITPLRCLLKFGSRREVGDLTLAALFSLQYCVAEDDGTKQDVRECLKKYVEGEYDDLLKRAAYMTSRAWGFDDFQQLLINEGSDGVLRVVALELSEKDLSEEEFSKKLRWFLKADINKANLMELLDRLLQRQYNNHPEAVIRFVHDYITVAVEKVQKAEFVQELFSGLARLFAKKLNDVDLMRVISGFLVSSNNWNQYFAHRIASNIDIGRLMTCVEFNMEVSILPYLFRKTLGWLYGRKEICVPMVLSCISDMSIGQFKEIEELFYDPVCLHYHTDVESYINGGLNVSDKDVKKKVVALINKAREFYSVFEKNGPCNELHPTAEMRMISFARGQRQMAEAQAKAMKGSLIEMLSGNRRVLLHGGKMISYVRMDAGIASRQVTPMMRHSISWPIPKLSIISGTHVEDILHGLRMEQLRK